MKTEVQILVVGDEKVGKTSLISTFVSQHFTDELPAVMHEVTLPRETDEHNILTSIMDSSSLIEDRPKLGHQIRRCDVIILLYAVDREETFARLSSFWLPLIEETTSEVPVVLIGNKIDTRSSDQAKKSSRNQLQSHVRPVLKTFKFVEAYDECSSAKLLNIQKVFYLAQKAVLYPIAPLYNMHEGTLTPSFVTALKRVFRIYDEDHDFVLNASELNKFQKECFDYELEEQNIIDLKKKISQEIPEGAVCAEGVLLSGFLYLNKLFLERSRPESSWEVLRKFNYNDRLELVVEDDPSPMMLGPSNQSMDHVGNGSLLHAELSESAVKFLKSLFEQFSEARRGVLNALEQQEIFSICPNKRAPWEAAFSYTAKDLPFCEITRKEGDLSEQGWLALWSLTTLLAPTYTIHYLCYLGYRDPKSTARAWDSINRLPRHAISFTSHHHSYNGKKFRTDRNVMRCYVFGKRRCGKSALLTSLLHQSFTSDYKPTTTSTSAINQVNHLDQVEAMCQSHRASYSMMGHQANSSKKILRDLPDNPQMNELKTSCDVICLAYDPLDQASFQFVRDLQPVLPSEIPCVYVATKTDCVPQDYATSPSWKTAGEYTASLELSPPLFISSKSGAAMRGPQSLFALLYAAAENPKAARPMTKERRAKLKAAEQINQVITATVVGGGMMVLLFVVWRLRANSSR